MKYLIFSDIHGSHSKTELMTTIFEQQHCDFMIILGDILYHGPRNSLPEGHNPAEVAKLLNKYASKIISVRGNCEAEVDQMVLDFACLSEYSLIVDEGIRIFATHGHIYNPQKLPNLESFDIFLYGHTHLYEIKNFESKLICNPGSISLPKENREASYAIYENKTISIFNLQNNLIDSKTL